MTLTSHLSTNHPTHEILPTAPNCDGLILHSMKKSAPIIILSSLLWSYVWFHSGRMKNPNTALEIQRHSHYLYEVRLLPIVVHTLYTCYVKPDDQPLSESAVYCVAQQPAGLQSLVKRMDDSLLPHPPYYIL